VVAGGEGDAATLEGDLGLEGHHARAVEGEGLALERLLGAPVDHRTERGDPSELLLELRVVFRAGVGGVGVALGPATPFVPSLGLVRSCRPFCSAGDVQGMTAGRGTMHQAMPEGDPSGRTQCFQLWANLPASLKMAGPRYQDTKAAEIPEVVEDDGSRARVIVGTFWGETGPVQGVAADPRYVDVSVPAGRRRPIPVEPPRNSATFPASSVLRPEMPAPATPASPRPPA
jgi:hypothetical protein